jgi:hypothetical protein
VEAIGRKEVARLESQYVRNGRGIPVDEILKEGIYGIDAKQGEDGSINVHMHVLADVGFLPQPALSEIWDDLVDAPVVHINRIYDRNESETDALAETVGYAAKAPEWETVEQSVSYHQALKGSKLLQPFGDLHGNTPDMNHALHCAGCERSPDRTWMVEWSYEGVIDAPYSTGIVGTSDGENDPPETDSADATAYAD